MNFVVRMQKGERVTDLCAEYGISRKTAYKFIDRYERLGAVGLYDESRAPIQNPRRIAASTENLIVQTRKDRPTWGPRKLKAWLSDQHPGVYFPAESTFDRILHRHELIAATPHRKRFAIPTPSHARTMAVEPNAVWCCDFKGQFRMGNSKYCYPLTITDLFSRYILCCESMDRIHGGSVKVAFTAVFEQYGLPGAIPSDNGPPFASTSMHALSTLSAWWLQLGIEHQRIEPGHPEQNGAHERMHLTLKKETTRPPGANLLQQQERFDRFRTIFNDERPHEALGQKPPASVYRSSPRPFPQQLPEPQYPHHDFTRNVSNDGRLHLDGNVVKLSRALAGQRVGLREISSDEYLVSFMHLDLGTYKWRENIFQRGE